MLDDPLIKALLNLKFEQMLSFKNPINCFQ